MVTPAITPTIDRQLPQGVADLFFKDAARRRAAERTLADTFTRWGYTEIIPPTFEFYEALGAEAGALLREEMYRFFDRDGRTLALRADFTIPTARIVGTKLYDRAMPLRFFYVGSVFRYEEPKAGMRHEFTQAGIELIGAATADADAEAIALAMTGLHALGLDDFRFTLGNTSYLRATLRDLALDEATDAAVQDAIRRKNAPELSRLLDLSPIESKQKEAIQQLTTLWGGREVLERAEQLAINSAARDAVDHLRAVMARLEHLRMDRAITLDLSDNRGMAYYTGILFEGFVEGLGFAVASGGRYDNLIAHFGHAIPAVGFAISVERVMMALRARGAARASVAPDVVAACSEDFQRIQAARDAGRIVEVDILDRTLAELREYARIRGAREIWFSNGQIEVLE